MTLALSDFEFLTSPTGACVLERLAHEDLSDNQTLSILTALRKELSPEQAGAALTMARLRQKAADKFGNDAARMFFTADALQQASNPLVRKYRAQGMRDVRVLDACCGIGTDSAEMARAGGDVLGLDIDPVRIAIARYNTAVLGVDARFEVADVRDGIPESDLIFYDPARRDEGGKRIYNVERYIPPLSLIRHWQDGLSATQIMVKLSPGVDTTQLSEYGGGLEFISVKGDLKEAVLWMGGDFTGKKATLLTGAGTFSFWRSAPHEPDVELSEPRGWLIEPDASILRAGLVRDVAAKFDGFMLDETIAYCTADEKPESVWARSWRILDWTPFNLKRLRAYLRERGVGRVTIKKRGFPMTPEELIPKLKLKGGESRTLVLTRCMGKRIVMVCEDIEPWSRTVKISVNSVSLR